MCVCVCVWWYRQCRVLFGYWLVLVGIRHNEPISLVMQERRASSRSLAKPVRTGRVHTLAHILRFTVNMYVHIRICKCVYRYKYIYTSIQCYYIYADNLQRSTFLGSSRIRIGPDQSISTNCLLYGDLSGIRLIFSPHICQIQLLNSTCLSQSVHQVISTAKLHYVVQKTRGLYYFYISEFYWFYFSKICTNKWFLCHFTQLI